MNDTDIAPSEITDLGITEQELAFLNYQAEGLIPTEAARRAGYKDPAQAAYRLSKNRRMLALNRIILQQAGLSLPRFAKVLAEALEATMLIKATFEGKITDERIVPDWKTRLAGVELAARLGAFFPTEERKIVVQDEGEQKGFQIPENFNLMPDEELMMVLQRR